MNMNTNELQQIIIELINLDKEASKKLTKFDNRTVPFLGKLIDKNKYLELNNKLKNITQHINIDLNDSNKTKITNLEFLLKYFLQQE